MLYYLLYPLSDEWTVMNVFRYITFRSVYAGLTAFFLSLWLGPWLIRRLRQSGVGQCIREDGPDGHQKKAGTPTMGGVMILASIVASVLLWARWEQDVVWITMFALVWFGGVGFLDDILKWKRGRAQGLCAVGKLALQVTGAALILWMTLSSTQGWNLATAINLPLLKQPLQLPLAVYVLVGLGVIAGASNGVNLTDGLDGLAIGALALVAGTFAVMSYLVANVKFANYLKIIHLAGTGELTVVCAALVGAALGFLWFNAYPAQIFMGDTGSLGLGGVLGTIAVLIKQELLLFVVGGLFVAEVVSVMVQVVHFKLTGRRVFLMAPLHHHYEMKGWSEPKVMIRFLIIAAMLALFTLSTLKLR